MCPLFSSYIDRIRRVATPPCPPFNYLFGTEEDVPPVPEFQWPWPDLISLSLFAILTIYKSGACSFFALHLYCSRVRTSFRMIDSELHTFMQPLNLKPDFPFYSSLQEVAIAEIRLH